jgi:hypothetical protein
MAEAWPMLENGFWIAATAWRHGKDAIEQAVSVDNVALHVMAGLALFVGMAALISGPRKRELAWIAVLSVAVWNEVVDITTERWPEITQQYAEAGIDLVATMILPTVLAILLAVQNRRRTTPAV